MVVANQLCVPVYCFHCLDRTGFCDWGIRILCFTMFHLSKANSLMINSLPRGGRDLQMLKKGGQNTLLVILVAHIVWVLLSPEGTDCQMSPLNLML